MGKSQLKLRRCFGLKPKTPEMKTRVAGKLQWLRRMCRCESLHAVTPILRRVQVQVPVAEVVIDVPPHVNHMIAEHHRALPQLPPAVAARQFSPQGLFDLDAWDAGSAPVPVPRRSRSAPARDQLVIDVPLLLPAVEALHILPPPLPFEWDERLVRVPVRRRTRSMPPRDRPFYVPHDNDTRARLMDTRVRLMVTRARLMVTRARLMRLKAIVRRGMVVPRLPPTVAARQFLPQGLFDLDAWDARSVVPVTRRRRNRSAPPRLDHVYLPTMSLPRCASLPHKHRLSKFYQMELFFHQSRQPMITRVKRNISVALIIGLSIYWQWSNAVFAVTLSISTLSFLHGLPIYKPPNFNQICVVASSIVFAVAGSIVMGGIGVLTAGIKASINVMAQGFRNFYRDVSEVLSNKAEKELLRNIESLDEIPVAAAGPRESLKKNLKLRAWLSR